MSFRVISSLSRASGSAIFVPKQIQQVRHLTPFGHAPTENFSWSGMKRHYAVLPLVILISATVVGVGGFIIYSSQTRENVVYRKSTKTLTDQMDLLNPNTLKIRVINQKYQPLTEVSALYKDMYGPQEAAVVAEE